jgi:D-hexose-6-phosphate mutarotase
MEQQHGAEPLRAFEIPGRIAFSAGRGGLARAELRTGASTAEVYLHGAQVTAFQKAGERPLLFLSRLSQFNSAKPIRGGVPICFPWFGPRGHDVAHGFARVTEWKVVESAILPGGAASLKLELPKTSARMAWPDFRAEFVVTAAAELTMELIVSNLDAGRELVFENCLHSYFALGDIRDVRITGLSAARYLDNADNGVRKQESDEPIRITEETNRIYPDAPGPVEIHDGKWGRTIRVEKSGSASTVLWNPWTTQQMADLGEEEYQGMVCVESGNVGRNPVSLAPGASARLKVILSSKSPQASNPA